MHRNTVSLPRLVIELTHTETTSPAESSGLESITYAVGENIVINIIEYTA